MIRFIATDIDGTLIRRDGDTIPAELMDQINFFNSRGVVFAAASGRQYANLASLFKGQTQHMAFICENGSLIKYGGRVVHTSAMDRERALALADEIYAREGCEVLVSCPETFYVKIKTPEYRRLLGGLDGIVCRETDDFRNIDEDIIKVSIYEPSGVAEFTEPMFYNKYKEIFQCVRSQDTWYDFCAPGTNKGSSLKILLDQLGISPADAMAFGDNYNDEEMLSMVGYGYVMDFAEGNLKRRIKRQTDDVVSVLRRLRNAMEEGRAFE